MGASFVTELEGQSFEGGPESGERWCGGELPVATLQDSVDVELHGTTFR